MRYWSVQDLPAWEEAQVKGYLTGSKAHILEPAWQECYDWMISQMQRRLGIEEDFQPVWMWTKRPDLRKERVYPPGDHYVLLEIEQPQELVLLSDFETWHCVLNDYSIDLYEDEPIDKQTSWERIFDFDLLRNADPDWLGGEPTPQATTPWVPVSHVQSVKHFIGRAPARR